MEWFFALDGQSATWFSDMVKVAVISARDNTSLRPHCIYDGPDNELTQWLTRNRVVMHRFAVPFRDELFSEKVVEANQGTNYTPQHASGTFLKICISRFASGLHYLLTDCDVMFVGDVITSATQTVATVREPNASNRAFNSGVMCINTDYYNRTHDAMVEFMRRRNFYDRAHSSFDQTLLNEFLAADGWDELPAEMNWRAFQGINDDARIVHFHGPKPKWIKNRVLNGDDSGLGYLTPLYDKNPESFAYYLGFFDSYLRRSRKM